MEGGEVGAQVAPAMFLHQPLPGRFRDVPQHMARKRDLAWQTAASALQLQQQQHHHQQYTYHHHHQPMEASPYPSNAGANWNCNMWDWDSRHFVARPTAAAAADGSDGAPLRIGNQQGAAAAADSDPRNRKDESASAAATGGGTSNITSEDDGGNLTLKLGGGPFTAATAAAAAAAAASPTEDAAARPNKRVRSGSPGTGGGNYPMCQVDDCKADLSSAKDYHRRHKVCEVHSKTTKALVGNQMQRFCQQCSRFHPLPEFDEGKRSCRRRLAGHNRRRRKTQPEDTPSRSLAPVNNRETNGNPNLDLVNILSILARLQGNLEKATGNAALPDKDRLINIINKINSAPPPAPSSKAPAPGGFDLNVPQTPPPSEQQPPKTTVSAASAPPTLDLLAALSAALKPAGLDNTGSPSHGSSDISADDRVKANSAEPMMGVASPEIGGISTVISPSTLKISENTVLEPRSTLQLQLFSSAEDDSPPKAGYARKYLSSESSNLMDDNRSPSSSPPVVRKFFPVHSDAERDECAMVMVEASTSHHWSSISVMKDSERGVQAQTTHNLPYHAGYTSSSSASDHSPSSSNSDAHDRTGRIVFKLFDKNPNDLPGALKSQILNWLSHIPSEMESYIRPGCVVLSVYVSMPPIVWDEFQGDLFNRIQLLLQSAESEFWRSGRFLVQTDRQLASHKDGRIRLSKTWKSWSSPEVMSVSPLAVVSGECTSLTLRGRNLTMPGTRIHCTYMGGYTSKEVVGSAYPGTVYDDCSVESFDFPAGAGDSFGRCFIEVENGFKGNSFPIIIADKNICMELNLLERELAYGRNADVIAAEAGRPPRSREDILHFLNELGWLFQRSSMESSLRFEGFSCLRFKYLLMFAVERDWSAVVRHLLDILVERSDGNESLVPETLEALLEVQLLSRAVKRKCSAMVDLLLNYSVVANGQFYPFVPNQVGPGGVTPLHIAASTVGSEDMVDALTNDPQQIGLKSWNCCTDESGQSPYDYAASRSNHSYNRLVARKVADRKNQQVSIMIVDEDEEETSLDRSWIVKTPSPDSAAAVHTLPKSCSKCATLEQLRSKGIVRSRGLLSRPYVHSMLAIAAVCVCVCLFLRGLPQLDNIAPFKWENLDFGSM